jgi:hypothetical protein
MGYCIELTDNNFKIKKENLDDAFKALKEFMKTKKKVMWVEPSIIIKTKDVFEAFEEIGYPLATDKNGDYILDYFCGEKLGDDLEILKSIAPYVEKDTYIEFVGEDGDKFRFVFDGNKCEDKYPTVKWE